MKIGVTPQTISLWLNHDDDFRRALWTFKKDALDAARSQLQIAAIEAVTVVRKLMQESSTDLTRVKAAQLLLDRLGLVGRNSGGSVDEAAIAPAGNYGTTPPVRPISPRAQEACRVALEILRKFARRRAMEMSRDATLPMSVPEESRGEN